MVYKYREEYSPLTKGLKSRLLNLIGCLRTVAPNTDTVYLCKSCDDGEKVDLSKGHWNLKRKILYQWVTMRLSEIIKQP